MHTELRLLTPWKAPDSPHAFELELRREVAPEHVLHGKPIRALAIASNRDDVLFAVEQAGTLRYAVVHLTWSHAPEPDPWPTTTFFDSLQQWIEWMKADHDEDVDLRRG